MSFATSLKGFSQLLVFSAKLLVLILSNLSVVIFFVYFYILQYSDSLAIILIYQSVNERLFIYKKNNMNPKILILFSSITSSQ